MLSKNAYSYLSLMKNLNTLFSIDVFCKWGLVDCLIAIGLSDWDLVARVKSAPMMSIFMFP
jgi:hypothetical protein